MPKSTNQKQKLFRIYEILCAKSDENHPLTTQQIIQELEFYGIVAERKSIYDDIATLEDMGLDIIKLTGRSGGYYLGSRQFELTEVKLLVDLVLSSKFITESKSQELVKKLSSLVSQPQAKTLQRMVVVADRAKTNNEKIYYNVDVIFEAIAQDVKIGFSYFQWNEKKEKELRRDGATYWVSPYYLLWDHENYYLVAYDDKADAIKHYRVDKMLNPVLSTDVRCGRDLANKINVADYTKKNFGMFSGAERTVSLTVEAVLLGVLVDRFGLEIPIRKMEDGKVKTHVDVEVSEQFFGWVCGFGTQMQITAPQDVVEEFRRYLNAIVQNYDEK